MACLYGNGVRNLQINGVTYKIDPDSAVEVWPLNTMRERGKLGGQFTEKDTHASCKFTLMKECALPIKTLYSLCDASVVIEMVDGSVYSFSRASQVASEPINVKEELRPVEFISPNCEVINCAAA